MSSFIMSMQPMFLGSPVHEVQSPGSLSPLCQTLGPSKPCQGAGLQWLKCVHIQITAFMKLSDSTSTSESAWVLLG